MNEHKETEMTQEEQIYRNVVPVLKARRDMLDKWIDRYEKAITLLYQRRCPHLHPQLGDEVRHYCGDCGKTLE
jgi:hypothetical protein